MPNPLIQTLVFLINTVFGIYIFLIMLRFLLQWLRVAFRSDPILRILLKLTDPPLRLLYNFIPGWHNIDFAAIFLMIVLQMLELILTNGLYGHAISMTGLFLLSIADTTEVPKLLGKFVGVLLNVTPLSVDT